MINRSKIINPIVIFNAIYVVNLCRREDAINK